MESNSLTFRAEKCWYLLLDPGSKTNLETDLEGGRDDGFSIYHRQTGQFLTSELPSFV